MHQRRGRTETGDPDDEVTQFIRSQPPETNVISTLAKKAWSSPKVKTSLALWLIGMLFMTVMPALVKITPEMRSTYESIVVVSTEEIFAYDDARAALSQAQDDLSSSQVWFWRWRPEHTPIVEKHIAIVAAKQSVVSAILAKRAEQQIKANSYVGLWSEYGMAEMKQKFWDSFESGKVFAQRQSFWQMFHVMLTSREEYFLSTFLRWVVMALINFTVCLIGALFYYTYSLFGMLSAYSTEPLSGVAFFVMSFLGGASVVATYLVGLYGLTAGGIYVVGKVLVRNAAIQYQREQQQQRLLRERRNQ